MARTCLNKLSGNILQSCTLPQIGIRDIYLIHVEDLAFTHDGVAMTSVTFAEEAKSYKVEGYKQNIQYTTSLKTTDASSRLNTSVSFKIPVSGAVMGTLSMGKFYVMVHNRDNSGSFVGAQSPLECTAMDYDSNSGAGLVTVTLADPEGSAGNAYMVCTNTVRESIISKSV